MAHVSNKIMSVVFIAAVIACGGYFLLKHLSVPSGYSNCAIVQDEADFVGKFLKTRSPNSKRVVKTPECRMFDEKLDEGNGPRKGMVRWAECNSGPDCDEAGWF